MKHLNNHIQDLYDGKKIAYRGKVYWLNDTASEIYAQSVEAEMSGCILGYKVADVVNGVAVAQ